MIMKNYKFIFLVFLFGFYLNGAAQDSEFKPSGKAFVKIYANYHSSISGADNETGFQLTRVYFGYKAKMSEEFSLKLTLDAGNPKNGSKLEQTVFLKNALVKYKKGHFSASFGLVGLTQHKYQEKQWAHRYIAKTIMDEHKISTSADLGALLTYKFNDAFEIDGFVRNGEGYKKLQADETYKVGGGINIKPVKGLFIRAYYDASKKDEMESTLATYLSYQVKGKFLVGVEYFDRKNTSFVDEQNQNGLSAFAMYNINKKIELFARYDNLSSNEREGATDAWNIKKDGSAIIGGVQYAPLKNVKIAVNVQDWTPAKSSSENETYIYLNFLYKF